jgi:hypothetical protein
MKKTLLSFALMLMAVCAIAQTPIVRTASLSTPAPAPAIAWEAHAYDFGQVAQGTPVSHTFEFTNTGKGPLRIESVKAACGCTATGYSQQEIAPGEKGFVTATYNAAKAGHFTKTVSVASNASETPIVLTLRGQVAGE